MWEDKMLDLLRIHDLDKYWYADNIVIKKPIMAFEQRYLEITDSLNRYPIDNYVVLDDMKALGEYFPNNSVITNDYISVNAFKALADRKTVFFLHFDIKKNDVRDYGIIN